MVLFLTDNENAKIFFPKNNVRACVCQKKAVPLQREWKKSSFISEKTNINP